MSPYVGQIAPRKHAMLCPPETDESSNTEPIGGRDASMRQKRNFSLLSVSRKTLHGQDRLGALGVVIFLLPQEADNQGDRSP
ncbi:hypothetical protein NEUTE1DRAFT_142847 [Neurospora tetrasperma FGSC 2508]|uniref:Uncharacterized protein n=1 Tax=Neurospora tetrasperma (strain FGSC 2508 / ATCC MYA-4615 / P0657) TaxID=510951 RepID=F8N0T2_NEUT8|nr:uncharacterized protein NEUTE1DRAFT_142847 [Neurospora tetrasperma FGSC 2508]EGO53018.1 hypothetical protein NEUTE1DRAFT_142847 [Neurospora tetrasperma FGSC 2508]